MLQKLSVT